MHKTNKYQKKTKNIIPVAGVGVVNVVVVEVEGVAVDVAMARLIGDPQIISSLNSMPTILILVVSSLFLMPSLRFSSLFKDFVTALVKVHIFPSHSSLMPP